MNSKKLCFRFDIDTHKCIRTGVPRLLDLSEEMGVAFTFFLNVGRAISLKESIKAILDSKNENCEIMPAEQVCKMSAFEKLGFCDYVFAATVNPKLCSYRKQVKRLIKSSSEVGIHGGKNHELWQRTSKSWTYEKTSDEIKWAVEKVKKINPQYTVNGFASPCWDGPECLDDVLQQLGFSYCADYKNQYGSIVDNENHKIPYIGVNMLGEPGGVAYIENCRVRHMDDNEILNKIADNIEKNDITVVYDHPYYAGIHEIPLIKKIIELCKDYKTEIKTLNEIAAAQIN